MFPVFKDFIVACICPHCWTGVLDIIGITIEEKAIGSFMSFEKTSPILERLKELVPHWIRNPLLN